MELGWKCSVKPAINAWQIISLAHCLYSISSENMVAQKPSPIDCLCPIKANLNDSTADVEKEGKTDKSFLSVFYLLFF